MQKLVFTLVVLVGIVQAYGQGRKDIISPPINSGYFADLTIWYLLYLCHYRPLGRQ